MKPEICVGILSAMLTLVGCGSSSPSVPLPDVTGNWQIQTSAITSSASFNGVALFGSLQSSAGKVTGIFRFDNLALPVGCSQDENQAVSFAGTIDSSRKLSLSSAPLPDGSVVQVELVVPADTTDFSNGTIAVAGSTCSSAAAAAIGVGIAPVSGTYSGALTTTGSPGSETSNTGSFVVTQASSPIADGEFPVTGTLSYVIASCTGSIALSGEVSGVGVNLTATPGVSGNPNSATLFGTVTPDSKQISVAFLHLSPAPCSSNGSSTATYSAKLARQ